MGKRCDWCDCSRGVGVEPIQNQSHQVRLSEGAMIVLGIDPGATGALVALHGTTVVLCEPMPAAPKVGLLLQDVAAIVRRLTQIPCWDGRDGLYLNIHAILEHAQAFPGMGVSSAFNYGDGFGSLKGVLAALGVPYTLVRPNVWHASLCGQKRPGEGRPAAKARALQVVQQRLPGLVLPKGKAKREGIVDAACLALWGQQRMGVQGRAA